MSKDPNRGKRMSGSPAGADPGPQQLRARMGQGLRAPGRGVGPGRLGGVGGGVGAELELGAEPGLR